MASVSELIHLPDLKFVRFCSDFYKVNRGVYNTIEDWFYHYGIVNVVERRKVIIRFFEYVVTNGTVLPSSKFIRFGVGGLTQTLEDFAVKHLIANTRAN